MRAVPAARADAYFAGRPRGSQLGAWASDQSRALPGGLRELARRTAAFERRFEGGEVPRPPHWGGFCLKAREIEFWSEGAHRLHERVVYRRSRASGAGWQRTKLFP